MTKKKIIMYTIGYEPEIYKFDDVVFEVLDESSIRINYLGMERDFEVFMQEWFPTEWKDDEEEQLYIPFTTEELMNMFESFKNVNICNDCSGNGYYEELEECYKPASECCGGCYKKDLCDCTDLIFPIV